MADDVLDQKVGELTLLDGVFVTASKVGTEEVLSAVPFVGNGTYRSGAIKLGGSLLLAQTKQRGLSHVATGMMVDGVEDMISKFKRQTGVSMSGSSGSDTARTSEGQQIVSL